MPVILVYSEESKKAKRYSNPNKEFELVEVSGDIIYVRGRGCKTKHPYHKSMLKLKPSGILSASTSSGFSK